MALLQALLALIGRSLTRILDAILGWAVVALFGRAAPRERFWLTALVGAAAFWPLLVLGVAFPRVAALVIAFVPLHNKVSGEVVRYVWIAAALLLPVLVGVVVNRRTREAAIDREPSWRTVLRGYPITLGIACAFVLLLVTLPALRLRSALRRQSDEHLPLITDRETYRLAVARVDDMNAKHHLGVTHMTPPWWMAWPTGLLRRLGGRAVLSFVPERLAFWRGVDEAGDRLELALYTSDLLIRGSALGAARVHALLAESFAAGPGLQTYGAAAQELERDIHELWRVLVEHPRHARSPRLRAVLRDVSADIAEADVSWEDWQVLYRKSLQLGRAIEGQEQIFEHTNDIISEEEKVRMKSTTPTDIHTAPTAELLTELVRQTGDLMKAEMALARAELKSDMRKELMLVVRGAIAGLLVLYTVDLLLVTAVLALALTLPAWASALIVAGGVFVLAVIAALFAWTAKVSKPLQRTQRTMKDNVRWAKERLA